MKRFKDLSSTEKEVVRKEIYDNNFSIASKGLLGFAVKKLAPTKENKKRFEDQFTTHSLCGCYSCMEIAKTFIDNSADIKEAIICESMDEIEVYVMR